ncbi:Uncharacterized protein dnm_094670 [Desulfonema magnum]|uniref:Uncharacterized protein n=1 Tax=Desulfonema magnum TaxID=45655 RepID=A0A975BX30_9BACT|nr:Uncharacterized protein dnm_094670 [Desulfonema magnum]
MVSESRGARGERKPFKERKNENRIHTIEKLLLVTRLCLVTHIVRLCLTHRQSFRIKERRIKSVKQTNIIFHT